jgi:hypothetical protein
MQLREPLLSTLKTRRPVDCSEERPAILALRRQLHLKVVSWLHWGQWMPRGPIPEPLVTKQEEVHNN